MVTSEQDFFRKWADWIVWSAGIFCFLLLFYFTSFRNKGVLKKGTLFSTDNMNNSDQLFLANGEFGFEDKKSFVLGTLRFQWTDNKSLSKENNRQDLYRYIYRQKLNNNNRRPAQNPGFSIKPVPK
jgi:hypothetical protein